MTVPYSYPWGLQKCMAYMVYRYGGFYRAVSRGIGIGAKHVLAWQGLEAGLHAALAGMHGDLTPVEPPA